MTREVTPSSDLQIEARKVTLNHLVGGGFNGFFTAEIGDGMQF